MSAPDTNAASAAAKTASVATRDFLVEIGTEELPPKSLLALSQAFTDGIVAGLAAAGVKHGAVQPYAAPRRLALLVKRVRERQPDQEIKRKGPPVAAAFDKSGAPTRAATAFAESCGTTLDALGRIAEAKGEFLYYTGTKPGAETSTLLAGIVQAALDKLPIAKRMRWGSGTAEFVRPVHWVVMLFGADVVPATILGVQAGNATRGHRFMAPKELQLASPASYAKRLESAGKVIADFAARRERIRAGVLTLAAEHGVEAIVSDALLDEVTALVEWPVPVAGRFEERFLSLPPEVLIATLQDHQRYFPTKALGGTRDLSAPGAGAGAANAGGGPITAPQLTSLFITISNLESRDPAQVRAGNERVVRPRLSDAAFFWDTDRKAKLADRREALKSVTFQAQLGSYHDKAVRVQKLGAQLAAAAKADAAQIARAAELAKCDLLTGLVGEFPELQGTMGAYYARHDGEAADVATAMAEQYLPRFAGDALPATGVGTALALADKLDTIVGIFAIGQKPSGAKDPFALRRAALGVLRIVLERKLEVDLPQAIASALAAAREDIHRVAAEKARAASSGATLVAAGAVLPDRVPDEVYDYVMERLRAYYVERDAGITTEMFDAVLEKRPASPLDFDARLRALVAFLSLPDAAALAAANKRIANILRKAEGADTSTLHADRLQQSEERALHDALEAVRPTAERLLDARDYREALQRLATLRPAVDAFFDKVMVMADDLAVRSNRLALLARVRDLFLRVADLSRLPG